MENQIEELTNQINKLGNKTIKIYEDGINAEQFNVRKQLQKFQAECEDIFKHYLGMVPGRVIDDITLQANELLRKEIGVVRNFECQETMANLGKSRADNVEDIKSGIENFKEDGIVDERRYEQKVDEISDRVIKAYRNVLEIAPSRNSEMAFDEIRGRGRITFNNIKEVHEECSKVIKSEVLKGTQSLDITLSSIELNKLEDKIDDRGVSDFSEQLKAGCKSQEEVANEDVKNMYESKEHVKDTRSDLEAMFK